MKSKDLQFMQELASDRIKEKQAILNNEKMIYNYMIKNNIQKVGDSTLQDIKKHIEKLEKYIEIALK